MWIRHSEFPAYPCLLTFRLKSGLNTVVWASPGPKNTTPCITHLHVQHKRMEHTTEFHFQCVSYDSSPYVREKSFLYARKEPPEFYPFKSKYSSAGCMSYNCYVGDLPLWGCLWNEAAARCTMNVFACLMRARRGSWILVIWVRMRLAACHGRSSLITYALAHN